MSDDREQKTVTRRKFLQVLGTTGAGAAVLSGCSTDKVEKLVPYLVQSEDQVPGVSTWYASTCTECSAGCGLHVRTREGRAVKLEGNPDHPVNAGRLCARGQAGLQSLYNPGRLKGPMQRQGDGWKEITWDEAIALLAQQVGAAGPGLAVLSGAGRGTFSSFLGEWAGAAGGRVVRWNPFDQDALRLASQRVFGRNEVPDFDFAKARYILSFGADFLDTWGATVQYQRQFAESHGFSKDHGMAKHVYLAPRASLTGLNADEWHAIAPGSETTLALAMAGALFAKKGGAPAGTASVSLEQAAEATGLPAETIARLAEEFAAAGPGLAVGGGVGVQGADAVELAAAVHLLNVAAGNVGQTVLFGADLDTGDGWAAVRQLQAAMDAGQVKVLLVHDANPVYATPKAGRFAEALAKVPFKVSTATVLDETAAACDLVLPNLHALERWDDANPRAGVWGLMQPVMEPVYAVRHTGDVLLAASQKAGGAFAKFNAPTFEAYLKDKWAARAGGGEGWIGALARGGVFQPAATTGASATGAQVAAAAPAFEGEGEFTLLPYASSLLYDGRGTNKPWLRETPDPVTKITWHAWVELHPDAARRLNVREGEILRVTSAHGSIEAPAYVYPGLRPDTVAIPMGFGHTEYGEFAKGVGANYLDLLGPAAGDVLPFVGVKVAVERVPNAYRKVAKTEGNTRQLGRGIAEAMPLAYAAQGLTVEEAAKAAGHPRHAINTERELEALQGWRDGQVGREDGEGRRLGNYAGEHPMWGMTIDLGRCTGCSACVTACYAENNIPWVGEDQVLRGRELSWMRIERYWEGGRDGEPVEARFVPMPCQHCDNAPCEPVCPVYAAYHTPDGLNGQIYNRCVGTRYCGNNCPYKVRYFNWHAYARKAFVAPLNLQLNPDVVVRARGVMEKCTFCVHRIRQAQHTAKVEDRALRDGDVVTACAQACPSGAITFGDMNDAGSAVSAVKQDRRGYHILEDINVRPAITYLAKVVHREPAHAAAGGEEHH